MYEVWANGEDKHPGVTYRCDVREEAVAVALSLVNIGVPGVDVVSQDDLVWTP